MAADSSAPAPTNATGQVVLDANSYWRVWLGSAIPVIRQGDKIVPVDIPGMLPKGLVLSPVAGWNKPEFDDSGWTRMTGPFFNPNQGHAYCREVDGAGYTLFDCTSVDLALICLRGNFTVKNPAVVHTVQLDLAYRGGVVVHLNGKEVARKNLPAGEIDAATLADDYPPEVYVKEGGKIISWGFGDPQKNADRLAKRIRRSGSIVIPASALRTGNNVLTVELHRAPYHEVSLAGEKKVFFEGGLNQSSWTTVGLVSLELRAEGGGVSGVGRPQGQQVWNANPMQSVFDVDQGDGGAPLQPLRLAGTRNGAFSGQIVLSSDAPIKGLTAAISALRQDNGAGVIPANNIQVRYALPGWPEIGMQGRFRGDLQNALRFDALEEKPLLEVPVRVKPGNKDAGADPGGAVQPVWVTVNVPRDVPAGNYKGLLAIEVAGKKTDVPVELNVAGWSLPDPQDYVTVMDFIQSPDSVAMQYGVEPWSEAHLKLVGRSFRLLSNLGCKTLYIPMISKTHFGNSESMVRWIKRKDGGHDLDFSRVEKYLDCALQNGVKPAVVALDVLEWYVGPKSAWGKGEQDPSKWQAPLVTEYDPETKTVHEMDAPKFPTPEAVKFWAEAIKGVQSILAKRGLEKTMMLGIVTDFAWLCKEHIATFSQAAPGVPWVNQGHAGATGTGGVPGGYATAVWLYRAPLDPDKGHTYAWQNEQSAAFFSRDLNPSWVMTEFRNTAEFNIAGALRGLGRMGADFWPVLGDSPDRKYILAGRYPEGMAGQLSVKLAFLGPGKESAISTIRLEMMREGLQECEARIFIEKALLDAGARAKLGEELAARCQEVLDERTRILIRGSTRLTCAQFVGSGWQARSTKLYNAAAEVATKLAGK